MFILDRAGFTDFVRMESLTLICSLLSCNLPLPHGMIQRPLVVLGRYLSSLDVTEKKFSYDLESILTSLISAFLQQNQLQSALIREVFVIALGARERLLQIIECDEYSPTVQLAATRLIGELCFHSDQEAHIFIALRFMEVAQIKLKKLIALNSSLKSPESEGLKAELCWALSNLKQDKINVAELALTLDLLHTLIQTYHLSSLTVKYEVVYLFSFYLSGQPYQFLQQSLPHLLPLLVTSLSIEDSSGHLLSLTLHSLSRLFKKACKHFSAKDNEVSRVFEDMGGIDACEQLQYHQKDRVYRRVIKFLLKYFDRVQKS